MGALIRSELSAMIFTKATRMKDVKHVTKVKASEASISALTQALERNDPINEPDKNGSLMEGAKEEQDKTEDMQKTRQATINLVGKLADLIESRKLANILIKNRRGHQKSGRLYNILLLVSDDCLKVSR